MNQTPTFMRASARGARPAGQARSKVLLRRFELAGQALLNDNALRDIGIPMIAEAAQSSVGGFYSRFDSKEGYFCHLCDCMMADHDDLLAHFVTAHLQGESDVETTVAAFVDVSIAIYSGPWRGVLRETVAASADTGTCHDAVRRQSFALVPHLVAALEDRLPAGVNTDRRMRFGVQTVVSVLNDALLRPDPDLGIDMPEFRHHLAQLLSCFLMRPPCQSRPAGSTQTASRRGLT
jgi:AcrR family transcriptional regulator